MIWKKILKHTHTPQIEVETMKKQRISKKKTNMKLNDHLQHIEKHNSLIGIRCFIPIKLLLHYMNCNEIASFNTHKDVCRPCQLALQASKNKKNVIKLWTELKNKKKLSFAYQRPSLRLIHNRFSQLDYRPNLASVEQGTLMVFCPMMLAMVSCRELTLSGERS